MDTHKPGVLATCNSAATASWRHKLVVVLTTLCLAIGANYIAAALPTLKTIILQHTYYHGHLIDNAKYGVMMSASTLINTVLPILSGVFVDLYGPALIAILFSSSIVVGSLLLALGASSGNFNLINAGEILHGIGNVTVHMCQLKLYAHWFRGSADTGPGLLGLLTGLDVAIGRVFGLIGTLTPIPLSEATGKWYWAFWLGLIFSIFAWALALVYMCYEYTLPSSMRVSTALDAKRDSVYHRIRAFLPQLWTNTIDLPAAFWILIFLQLLQTGVVATYGSNTVDIMVQTRGHASQEDVKLSAYKYSMHYAIPIVLTPLVGYGFDLWGHRSHVIIFGAAFYVISMALLGFSHVHPAVPLLFDAFGYTINNVPFVATIPLLVKRPSLIGTAHGFWKSYNASGETIMQIVGGALQDRAVSNGLPQSQKYNYMLYLLLAMKGVDFFYGMIYHYLDTRYFGSVMLMSEKQRAKQEAELDVSGDTPPGTLCSPRIVWTVAGCIVSVLMIAAAYTIFIVFWITDPERKPGSA
mgnify:FL=1